jgi:hypothetical protein
MLPFKERRQEYLERLQSLKRIVVERQQHGACVRRAAETLLPKPNKCQL